MFSVYLLNASIVHTSTSGEYYYNGMGTFDDPYTGFSRNSLHPSSASIIFTATASGIVDITTSVESEPGCDFAYLYYNGTEKWKGSGIEQYNMYLTIQIGDTFEFKYSKDYSVSTYLDHQDFSIYFMGGIPTSSPTSYPTNIPTPVRLPIVHTSTSGKYYYNGMGTIDEPYIGNSRNRLDSSSASIIFTATASGVVYISSNVEATYRLDGPYGAAFFYYNDVEKWRGYGINKYNSSFTAQIGDTFEFKYEKYDTYYGSRLAQQQEFSIYFMGIPTSSPTSIPTLSPSTFPTSAPTNIPTMPSSIPTIRPSSKPTYIPTYAPTNPTSIPTKQPTGQPSSVPTSVPSSPSSFPTSSPSSPSGTPTSIPTCSPTILPTSSPSNPSGAPTSVPSSQSGAPTGIPTLLSYPIKCNSNTIDSVVYRSIPTLSNTTSALQNYYSIEIEIEDASYIDFSTCTSNGDTYMRLYDNNGVMIEEDDDGCGYLGCGCGSKILKSVDVNYPYVTNMYIRLGCWSNTTCTMTLEMRGCKEIIPSPEPTSTPTTRHLHYMQEDIGADTNGTDTNDRDDDGKAESVIIVVCIFGGWFGLGLCCSFYYNFDKWKEGGEKFSRRCGKFSRRCGRFWEEFCISCDFNEMITNSSTIIKDFARRCYRRLSELCIKCHFNDSSTIIKDFARRCYRYLSELCIKCNSTRSRMEQERRFRQRWSEHAENVRRRMNAEMQNNPPRSQESTQEFTNLMENLGNPRPLRELREINERIRKQQEEAERQRKQQEEEERQRKQQEDTIEHQYSLI